MFKEAEIRTFIEGTTNYFETSAQQSATVGSPYLVTDGKPGAYEYTGVIGITGARKGIVGGADGQNRRRALQTDHGLRRTLARDALNANRTARRGDEYGDAGHCK